LLGKTKDNIHEGDNLLVWLRMGSSDELGNVHVLLGSTKCKKFLDQLSNY
jgi:hypothetical protein